MIAYIRAPRKTNAVRRITVKLQNKNNIDNNNRAKENKKKTSSTGDKTAK